MEIVKKDDDRTIVLELFGESDDKQRFKKEK